MKAPAQVWELRGRPATRVRRDILDRATGNRVKQKKRLYFNLMKNDKNENITRYLSFRPNAKNWPEYILEDEMLAFFYIDGEFRRSICTRSRTLNLHSVNSYEYPEEQGDAIFIKDVKLAYEFIELSSEKVESI